MALRATKEDRARTRELQKNLTPESQQFLKRHQLQLPGTKDEITTDVDQKAILLPKQREAFHQILAKRYSEAIGDLIKDERSGQWKGPESRRKRSKSYLKF
jgi:Spy/CpxP family protein refolding chaperone